MQIIHNEFAKNDRITVELIFNFTMHIAQQYSKDSQ